MFTNSNSTSKSKKSARAKPIFTDQGKIAGVVRGKVLDIRKRESHLLRVPPGIGVSVDVLSQAEAEGAEVVQVTVIESGAVYRQPIANIKRFSPIQRRAGYEPQYISAFVYWQLVGEGRGKVYQPAPERTPDDPEWRQMTLGG